ncbi:putative LRR receptor-like serine/threonine-protein kinase [Carex littledalei]|uniref:Putative LRR receptor-like serine/threonine-protein kinase n=1 Tax=Carex littledalei TaxID=544730 RepID=A0A833VHS1_9POAL|nr:putative LRR receptor-like serine/threonine-protein kinase [Carex littledalei]
MSSSKKTSFPLLTLSLFLLLPFSQPLAPTRPGSSLDPRQQTALESLGFPATSDACAVPSPRDNATSCDGAAPFRHLTSLRLANCSTDLDLPYTVLQSLSTLKSVSFLNCPIPPPRRLPPQLASSLHSFSCISSLRRVPGALLSPLRNLTELYLSGVPVTESAPIMIISQMVDLTSLTVSNANLSGPIPHHWHCLDLTHLDFSFNRLKGIIPGTISMLGSLQTFNLSSNFLTGNIPDSMGDMVSLKNVSLSNNSFFGSIPSSLSDLIDLVQLDLSSNHFNGSIPTFFSGLKKLRVLNLEGNNFQGVIPFNASFISKLQVFKVGGNSNLCYNHSILSSKLRLGVAPCNRYGLPMSPPTGRTRSDTSSDDMDDYGEADSGNGGGGHRGPNKLVLGIAIGLSCLVFLVIFLFCLSKVCGSS